MRRCGAACRPCSQPQVGAPLPGASHVWEVVREKAPGWCVRPQVPPSVAWDQVAAEPACRRRCPPVDRITSHPELALHPLDGVQIGDGGPSRPEAFARSLAKQPLRFAVIRYWHRWGARVSPRGGIARCGDRRVCDGALWCSDRWPEAVRVRCATPVRGTSAPDSADARTYDAQRPASCQGGPCRSRERARSSGSARWCKRGDRGRRRGAWRSARGWTGLPPRRARCP